MITINTFPETPATTLAKTMIDQLAYAARILPMLKEGLCLSDDDLAACTMARTYLRMALVSADPETECEVALCRSRALLAETLFRQNGECGQGNERGSLEALLMTDDRFTRVPEAPMPRPLPSLSKRFWQHFFAIAPSETPNAPLISFARTQ